MHKQVVHYDDSKPCHKIGNRALLFPLNHPDTDNVSNTMEAMTSPIVSWDVNSGVIETQNTFYVPISSKES